MAAMRPFQGVGGADIFLDWLSRQANVRTPHSSYQTDKFGNLCFLSQHIYQMTFIYWCRTFPL